MIIRVFRQYGRRAKSTGREFDFSFENFQALVQKPCHYCGAQDVRSWASVGMRPLRKKYPGAVVQDVLINGLDRVEQDRGYTLDNCVSCCKLCNYGKHTQSQTEYIERCRRVAELHPV